MIIFSLLAKDRVYFAAAAKLKAENESSGAPDGGGGFVLIIRSLPCEPSPPALHAKERSFSSTSFAFFFFFFLKIEGRGVKKVIDSTNNWII